MLEGLDSMTGAGFGFRICGLEGILLERVWGLGSLLLQHSQERQGQTPTPRRV